jgi:acyl-CoA thioester hydrolase
MYQYEVKLRVRYGETDKMGVVYYGSYALYYEVARVEGFRNVGFSYKELEENGIMMPVLDMRSRFVRGAKFDDLLTVKVTIPTMPSVKITFLYDIYDEEGNLIHKGETNLAFVNMKTGKPCRPPQNLIDLLSPYYDLAKN